MQCQDDGKCSCNAEYEGNKCDNPIGSVDLSDQTTITKITIKTLDAKDAQTDDPVFIKICNEKLLDCCETELENPQSNDFEKDEVNEFNANLLGECGSLSVDEIKTVTMRMEGKNGWKGEYVKVELSNGNEVTCPITEEIDNNGSMNLNCSLSAPEHHNGKFLFKISVQVTFWV